MNNEISIIPNYKNYEKSIELAKKWHAYFEWNDFFSPSLLDDRDELSQRIFFWKKIMAENNMQKKKHTLHGAFLDVTLHSMDSKIAEVSKYRLQQSMEIADELDARAVIIHSGLLKGFEDEQYIDNWLNTGEMVIKEFFDRFPNLNIYMENMFDEHPYHLQNLAKRLNSSKRFGICLDYAHACLYGGNVKEWFEALLPYIKHMHINDHDGVADRHQCVGKGVTDWGVWCQQIKEYNYNGSILIEVNGVENQNESLEYLHKLGFC